MVPITWALLALFCIALAVGNAAAQNSNSTVSQDNSAQPRQATDRMEHISNQLNLTSDQKDKLRPMLNQEQKEMMDLRQDPNLTEDQKRAKEREIHQKYKSQVEGVLTPEQRTKFREQRQEAVNKRNAQKSRSSTTGPSSSSTPPMAVGNAGDQNSNSTVSQDSRDQPRQATDRMEHVSNQLNLTPDQKDKLRPMLNQEQKDMMDLRQDPNLTEDQKRAKEKEIHQKYKSQVEGVLTPEQRTKYRQERQKAVNKRNTQKSRPSTTGPSSSSTPPK